MIELRNITKTYKTREGEHQALKGINLHVAAGEVCGIIGESGAGKSTLVRCINLLERPTSGAVIIGGVDVTNYHGNKLRNLRSDIGMIFQNFSLFQQRTVLDNVVFPLTVGGKGNSGRGERSGADAQYSGAQAAKKQYTKAQARQRAEELLEIVGLKDKAHQYPSQLSGGQQQRVAIARALANNPKLMLCDEATSALDTRTTVSVLNLLKKINEDLGVTLVLITHSLSVARYACNHVAVLDAGKIVEEGNTQDVFANPQSSAAQELVAFENFDGAGAGAASATEGTGATDNATETSPVRTSASSTTAHAAKEA